MLDKPEVISAINAFTVPVNPITPDMVLPDTPVFDSIRYYLDHYPWGRTNFAWYMLTDPLGEVVLGCEQEKLKLEMAGKEPWSVEHFNTLLGRARRIVAIGDDPDPGLKAERHALLEEAHRQVSGSSLSLARDPRVLTIYWICSYSWRPLFPLAQRIHSDPGVFAPGVANLVLAALAEIVTSNKPLHPPHAPVLERLFELELENREVPEADRVWNDGDVIPRVFRKMAAEAVEMALGKKVHRDGEDVVDGVGRWWRENSEGPRFAERPPVGDYRLVTGEAGEPVFESAG